MCINMSSTSTRPTKTSDSDIIIISDGPSKPIIKFQFKKKQISKLWGAYRHNDSCDEDEDNEAILDIMGDISKQACKEDIEPDGALSTIDTSYIQLPENLTAMDPAVLHTIHLKLYATKLERMIKEIYEKPDTSDDMNLYPVAPEVPMLTEPIKRRKRSFFPFFQLDRDETDFLAGKGKPELRLSFANGRSYLKKSVAALLAHAGYHQTKASALDVLTDVVGQLFNNLGDRLRVAVDQETMLGLNGFNDPVERVFQEMNLGSLVELFRYYECNVRTYHDILEEQCKDYAQEYSTHVKCQVTGQTEVEQEEEYIPEEEEEMLEDDNDEEDVPEIHFPALDMDDQLGLQPSLEPGFQMLDSLEHDETLQNLDPDEEINVSDSPNQEFMLSVISELSKPIEPSRSKKKKSRK